MDVSPPPLISRRSLPSRVRATVRVLVAESAPLTGQLIADALRRDRGLSVTDTTSRSVVHDAAAFQPDVVILSESLEGTAGKGFEILKDLKTIVPSARTIMMVDTAERQLVVEAFRRGAQGVFCRNQPMKMLSKCVHRVHEGQLWISDNQVESLLEALVDAPTTPLVNSRGAKLLTKSMQLFVSLWFEPNAGTFRPDPIHDAFSVT